MNVINESCYNLRLTIPKNGSSMNELILLCTCMTSSWLQAFKIIANYLFTIDSDTYNNHYFHVLRKLNTSMYLIVV